MLSPQVCIRVTDRGRSRPVKSVLGLSQPCQYGRRWLARLRLESGSYASQWTRSSYPLTNGAAGYRVRSRQAPAQPLRLRRPWQSVHRGTSMCACHSGVVQASTARHARASCCHLQTKLEDRDADRAHAGRVPGLRPQQRDTHSGGSIQDSCSHQPKPAARRAGHAGPGQPRGQCRACARCDDAQQAHQAGVHRATLVPRAGRARTGRGLVHGLGVKQRNLECLDTAVAVSSDNAYDPAHPHRSGA